VGGPFTHPMCIANPPGSSPPGRCAVTCDPGHEDCNHLASDGCETELSSSMSCGGCNVRCNDQTVCTRRDVDAGEPGYACTCRPGRVACGSLFSCFDLMTDRMHCGSCENACPEIAGATVSCSMGSCAFVCMANSGDCDGDRVNGCETALRTDATHCGSCETVCHGATNAAAACTAGRCTLNCTHGHADCDGDITNGCETDTNQQAGNCGMCGTVCRAYANSVGTCLGGICAIQCVTGYSDCDGNTATGCETLGSCAGRDAGGTDGT
jgi:hypothetical protein